MSQGRALEVYLTASLRDAAGGAQMVLVHAETIRELFRKLSERYPGFEEKIEQGIAVSIDGDIYRDSWNKRIRPDAEVYLLPRVNGG